MSPASVIFVSSVQQQPIVHCSKITYYSVLDEKKTDMKGSVYRSRGSSAVADSTKATLDNENEKGALVMQQEKRKNIYSNNAINNLQVCSSQ